MSFIADALSDVAADDYEPPRAIVRQAGPINTYILKRFGYAGICWPWRRIYLLPEYMGHEKLIAHEMIHIEQIDRHGPVWFTVLYLWYHFKHGYKGNKFEIEAYRRSHDTA